MNAIAAITKALLEGRVLTIKTSFNDFGITNLPREISRGVEKKFGVVISKMRRTGETKYKVPCSWYEYRFNPVIENNADGKIKMQQYVLEHDPTAIIPAGKIIQKQRLKKQKEIIPSKYNQQTLL